MTSERLRGSPFVLSFYPKDDTPGCTTETCPVCRELATGALAKSRS